MTDPLIRRGLILVTVLACLTTVVSASPSIAYVDVGKDPQEGISFDIRSSRRWVAHTDEGRRLVVTVRMYHPGAPFNSWSFRIFLDSRGAHRPDFYVFTDGSDGPYICEVHKYGGSHPMVSSCEVRVNDPAGVEVIRVRVTARDVRPDKHIRWRIFAPPLVDDTTERAPDQGWYD
jgi:hypothetical protein